MLITFEGGEGAGKTTLIAKLASKLAAEGFEVVVTREPGGTPLGEKIRSTLLEKEGGYSIGSSAELLLFLASRAQHLEERILPALAEGKIVFCDRFNDSSIAYQGVARGLGFERVEQMCTLACHGVTPDLTLFLDVDPSLGMARLPSEKDRMEEESLLFHQKIRLGFQEIQKRNPQRVHTLDASRTVDEVFQEAWLVLSSKMREIDVGAV